MTKKLITFLTVATFVATFVMQQISFASPDAVFKPSDLSLNISGSIGDKAGIPYTVSITARSDGTPSFSKTNPPLTINLFETGYEGELADSINLPPYFEGGEYTAVFAWNDNNEDKLYESHFSYTNKEEPATLELLKLLNGEDSGDKTGAKNEADFYTLLSPRKNITKFGIVYDNVFNSDASIDKIPFMSDVTFSMRALQPDSKFTFEALTNTLFDAEAAYDIKSDGLTGAGKHSSKLGEMYLNLNELSETETKKLDSLLKSASYKGKSLLDIFTEKYIMSEFICADTRLKIKDNLLNYHTELGIDISKGSRYDSVKEERLYIIYDGILEEISDDTVLSDIKSYFDKYVTKALTITEDNKKPSSDRAPSSVISGGNLTNPNTTTTQPPAIVNPVVPPAQDSEKTTFTDINEHFSKESVEKLSAKNVISGYPDGSFKPDGKVTRAEFSKIAVLAFDIKSDVYSDFNDISRDAWYAKYVGILAHYGIVTGYEGLFRPDEFITREDAAVIIDRIFKLKNINLSNGNKQFEDSQNVSDYAKESVAILANAKIINGDGIRFYPKNLISRGETAVLVCNCENVIEGGSKK